MSSFVNPTRPEGELRPLPIPLGHDEEYVWIMDDAVIWPALTIESRYLNAGLRPDVARAFCDWSELYLADLAFHHGRLTFDYRDVEVDHTYYVDERSGGPAVARLTWDVETIQLTGDPELDERPSYDLVVEPSGHHGRIWLGANHWMWERAGV